MTTSTECPECGAPGKICYGCVQARLTRQDALDTLDRALPLLEDVQEELDRIGRQPDQEQAGDLARVVLEARAARRMLKQRIQEAAE